MSSYLVITDARYPGKADGDVVGRVRGGGGEFRSSNFPHLSAHEKKEDRGQNISYGREGAHEKETYAHKYTYTLIHATHREKIK